MAAPIVVESPAKMVSAKAIRSVSESGITKLCPKESFLSGGRRPVDFELLAWKPHTPRAMEKKSRGKLS
jgi:hypothetical protein